MQAPTKPAIRYPVQPPDKTPSDLKAKSRSALAPDSPQRARPVRLRLNSLVSGRAVFPLTMIDDCIAIEKAGKSLENVAAPTIARWPASSKKPVARSSSFLFPLNLRKSAITMSMRSSLDAHNGSLLISSIPLSVFDSLVHNWSNDLMRTI